MQTQKEIGLEIATLAQVSATRILGVPMDAGRMCAGVNVMVSAREFCILLQKFEGVKLGIDTFSEPLK